MKKGGLGLLRFVFFALLYLEYFDFTCRLPRYCMA